MLDLQTVPAQGLASLKQLRSRREKRRQRSSVIESDEKRDRSEEEILVSTNWNQSYRTKSSFEDCCGDCIHGQQIIRFSVIRKESQRKAFIRHSIRFIIVSGNIK